MSIKSGDIDTILHDLLEYFESLQAPGDNEEDAEAALARFSAMATAVNRVSEMSLTARRMLIQRRLSLNARYKQAIHQAVASCKPATAGMPVSDHMGRWQGLLLSMKPPCVAYPAGSCTVCLFDGSFHEYDARYVFGNDMKTLNRMK